MASEPAQYVYAPGYRVTIRYNCMAPDTNTPTIAQYTFEDRNAANAFAEAAESIYPPIDWVELVFIKEMFDTHHYDYKRLHNQDYINAH